MQKLIVFSWRREIELASDACQESPIEKREAADLRAANPSGILKSLQPLCYTPPTLGYEARSWFVPIFLFVQHLRRGCDSLHVRTIRGREAHPRRARRDPSCG